MATDQGSGSNQVEAPSNPPASSGKKTKPCKSCGKQIAKNAKTCPNCGAKNGMSTGLKVLIGLVIAGLVITIGVVSCTSLFVSGVDSAIKETSKGSEIKTSDGKVISGDDAKKATFTIGEELTVDKVTFKLSQPKNVAPGEYSTAKSGNAAVFHLTVTNNSDSTAYMSSSDFAAYVSDTKVEELYLDGFNFSIEGIASGKKVEGDIVYDIPKGTAFEIVYTPNFLTDQEITFTGTTDK